MRADGLRPLQFFDLTKGSVRLQTCQSAAYQAGGLGYWQNTNIRNLSTEPVTRSSMRRVH